MASYNRVIETDLKLDGFFCSSFANLSVTVFCFVRLTVYVTFFHSDREAIDSSWKKLRSGAGGRRNAGIKLVQW